jgi:sorting nexin-8
VGTGVEEVITVTSLPEKEGMFMFQHRNYEVASARRNSKVIRRYSDFVWLLDCLHKRYPFRQLPLLPPKRVAINGNYIAADTSFVEKRRRGLARFANALVRHPILSQEQLIIMFLTVPTELAVWRKQATISVQEEFVGKTLPSGLEDSLPSNIEELFEGVRSGVRRSAEIYINLSNMMERLAKRNEGVAAEYARFSTALSTLTDATADTYKLDTNDVPMINEGLKATARHLGSSQSLLEDEAKAWDVGVLEDLKKQRDILVSVRDLFDRRDRYDRDNIPQLERRIKNNEDKLVGLRNRPEGLGKPGDIEKVEDAIVKVYIYIPAAPFEVASCGG